jgi:hypothetical protein
VCAAPRLEYVPLLCLCVSHGVSAGSMPADSARHYQHLSAAKARSFFAGECCVLCVSTCRFGPGEDFEVGGRAADSTRAGLYCSDEDEKAGSVSTRRRYSVYLLLLVQKYKY